MVNSIGNNRNSSIELLRLVAMLGIVLSHWGGHGSLMFVNGGGYLSLTQYFGEVGNCIFLLITGYYSANRIDINIANIRKLVIDVKFYAIAIWFIALIFGIVNFSFGSFIKFLLPIVYSQYWFFTPFLVVCFFSPVLNMIIEKSSHKYLLAYLVLLITIELILPLIKASTLTSNLGLFILVYSIGAVLRKRSIAFSKLCTYRYFLLTGLVFALVGLNIFGLFVSDSLSSILNGIIRSRFTPLPLICALSLFCIFSKFSFSNMHINKVAASTFAIYLISEHPSIYPWLWKLPVLNNIHYINSDWMIPISILLCIAVMSCCIVLDMLYKRLKSSIL